MAKLKDFADVQTGPFGSQLHKEDYVKVGTPIVTVEHLGNRIFTEQNLPMVSDEDKERLSKYVLQEGDTVFSRVGSVDRCSYVDSTHEGWMFSGRCLRVRPNDTVNPEYLYYFFTTESTKQLIRSIAVGATMPSINTQILSDVEIELPDIDIQNKIAKILSTIDGKIENNNQINRNLSEQALAIYTDLFGDAEKNSTVEEVSINVTDGVHNTVKDDPEGEFYLLSCKNIKGGSLSLGEIERKINRETFEKLRKRTKLEKGDILLSSVGTIGELLLLKFDPERYEFQRSVAIIKPNKAVVSSEYLYCALLSQKQEIIHAGHGAVQQCIFISDIKGFEVHKPEGELLIQFNNKVSPMMELIHKNEEENKRLSSLRDSLLPKLMSGELNVSNLDI